MALPIIPDVVRVTVNQTMGPKTLVNVLHVFNNTAADIQDAAARDVGAAWIASGSIKAGQSGDLGLISITALALDGTAAGITIVPTGWPTTGSQGTASEAVQVAAIATLKTGLGGRRRRGRMYIAGLTTSDVDTDSTRWATTSVGTWQGRLDVFKNALDPGPNGSSIGVASYAGSDFALVTSIQMRQYFGTQRRRAN